MPKCNGQWTLKQAENTVGKCMVCCRCVCQQWNSELVWQQWEQAILGTAHTFFLGVRGTSTADALWDKRWFSIRHLAAADCPDEPHLGPLRLLPTALRETVELGLGSSLLPGAVPFCSSATAVSLHPLGNSWPLPSPDMCKNVAWSLKLRTSAELTFWDWRHIKSSEFKWPSPAHSAGSWHPQGRARAGIPSEALRAANGSASPGSVLTGKSSAKELCLLLRNNSHALPFSLLREALL